MSDVVLDELAHELDLIDKALDSFIWTMREKMHAKAVAGYRGWNNPDAKVYLRNLLQEHVTKDIRTAKQMVDVANLAMMIWFIELLENSTIEVLADDRIDYRCCNCLVSSRSEPLAP